MARGRFLARNEMPFPAVASASRPSILVGTLRNAPAQAKAGLVSMSGTGRGFGVRSGYGSGHSLRAETVWLLANGCPW